MTLSPWFGPGAGPHPRVRLPPSLLSPSDTSRGRDTLPLAIAYKSSFGDDRPYRGESFREPAFFAKKRMVAARHKFHIHQLLTVRYRTGAPVQTLRIPPCAGVSESLVLAERSILASLTTHLPPFRLAF